MNDKDTGSIFNSDIGNDYDQFEGMSEEEMRAYFFDSNPFEPKIKDIVIVDPNKGLVSNEANPQILYDE